MTDLRTTRSTVRFQRSFTIAPLEETLPAGIYEIDTEEEIFEGNERRVFVRVATLLYVRSAGKVQIVTIDPKELEAALLNDGNAREQASAPRSC